MRRTQRIFDFSQAWGFWGPDLVGFDMSMTRAMALRGLDTRCLADGELEAMSATLGRALAAVPDGAMLRFYAMELRSHRKEIEAYRDSFGGSGGIGAQIAVEKALQCATSTAPRKRELLCCVTMPGGKDFLPDRISSFLGRERAHTHRGFRQARQDLASCASRLSSQLTTAGINAAPLGQAQFFRNLWRLANPVAAQRSTPPTFNPALTLRAQLFASGLYNSLDHFERDGQLHRIVTLKSLPQAVVPSQILMLMGLPFAHVLHVTVRKVGQDKARSKVEGARDSAFSWRRQIVPAIRKGGDELEDHQSGGKQNDSEATLAHLHNGDSLFEVAVQIWFSAMDVEQLDRQTDYVLDRFRSCGHAEGAVEEYRAHLAFLGMLPGHHRLIKNRFNYLLGSRVADLLPVYQEHSGTPKPSYLLTTANGSLVGWDPFYAGLSAHNATVLGATGKGKSFAVRLLLTGFLAKGGRVIVVTRGNDYHRYADLFGGDVYDVTPDDPNLALGPFFARSQSQGSKGRGRIVHLANILGVMASSPGQELARVERRLLFAATRRVYAAPEGPTPTLLDWLQVLRALGEDEPQCAEHIARLEQEVRFWAEGPCRTMFVRNRPPTDARLAVWNLAPIEDNDTRGVVLALLSGAITQSIQAGPTVVIFDEVWSFLNSAAGAELISTLYRTVRKEGSAVMSVSQSINDITSLVPKLRAGMLNNAPVSLFLEQVPGEVSDIAKTFQLNERLAEVLGSLRGEIGKHSDLLMMMGDTRHVVRLYPTPTEYWMATSHPKDVALENKVRARYPKHSRAAIVAALAKRYPHGAVAI